MHHIAIMNPSWKLIPKILSGEKKIESRWYKTRRLPWNAIKKGDIIFFKDAGKPVTAKAEVEKVMQFLDLDSYLIKEIIKDYGEDIALVEREDLTWYEGKKYCILIFLKNPQKILPFDIDKTGFGSGAAWISVEDVERIRL